MTVPMRPELLAEAGRRLAESLDPDATLAAVTELLVPGLADWCIVDLLHDDGTVERAAVVHRDPARADLAAGLRRYPPDLERPGVAIALRTGRSDLDATVTDDMLVRISRDEHHLAILRALGVASHMRVPLRARGRVLGSLLLIAAESGRRYDAADLATAEELAGRCALALDNARLHTAERAAARRQSFLAAAGAALGDSLDYDATLRRVAALAVPDLADYCFVDLLTADGKAERVAVAHRDPAGAALVRDYPPSLDRPGSPTEAALREGRPQLVAEVTDALLGSTAVDPSHLAALRALAPVSMIAAPLRARRRALGVISLVMAESGRRFGAAEVAVAEELADRAALAIDRARLFAEVRASEERFRGIYEQGTVGMVLVDRDIRLLAANPAYCRLVGYPQAALIGTSIGDLVHADDLGDDEADLARLLAGELDTYQTEKCYRHQDGHPVWVLLHVAALRDANRSIRGVVGQMIDLTERRRAEELLARYRLLSEHGRDILLFIRPRDGQIVEANAAAVAAYGYAREDLLALTIADLRALETRPLMADQVARAAADGILFETVHRRRDGTTFPVEVSSRGADVGGEALLLSIIRDIGERKRAEAEREQLLAREKAARAEAEAAVRSRDEFLSIAAHELLTPVTALKGYVQTLQRAQARGHLDPERLSRSLDRVNESADRLTELTRDLLDVARLRTGRLPIRPRPFELPALVARAADACREQLEAAHMLTIAVEDGLPPVQGDPERLEQVLTNLLGNAAKYSPEGGEVRLTVRPDGDGVLLTVDDHGIGLPPGSEEAIFQPFGRAANAERRAIQGMGLGLYICRHIVDEHGGRLWATSPGEGRGSTFSVWLPREHGADVPSSPDGA